MLLKSAALRRRRSGGRAEADRGARRAPGLRLPDRESSRVRRGARSDRRPAGGAARAQVDRRRRLADVQSGATKTPCPSKKLHAASRASTPSRPRIPGWDQNCRREVRGMSGRDGAERDRAPAARHLPQLLHARARAARARDGERRHAALSVDATDARRARPGRAAQPRAARRRAATRDAGRQRARRQHRPLRPHHLHGRDVAREPVASRSATARASGSSPATSSARARRSRSSASRVRCSAARRSAAGGSPSPGAAATRSAA